MYLLDEACNMEIRSMRLDPLPLQVGRQMRVRVRRVTKCAKTESGSRKKLSRQLSVSQNVCQAFFLCSLNQLLYTCTMIFWDRADAVIILTGKPKKESQDQKM